MDAPHHDETLRARLFDALRVAIEQAFGLSDAELSLEVENHNWSDVVIYLLRSGQPQRIGMVTAHSTSTFVFPYRRLGASGNSRLSAYPIGGGSAFNSENLLVQPGQSIKWTLETDLSRSSLVVY